jgi:hypothetical protein
MNTEILCSAIVGHLVGDYLLQNDWMALNKKKPNWLGFEACVIHCWIWASSVCVFTGWWGLWAPLAFTHYLQDRGSIVSWYMREIGQRKFAEPPLGPWSVIVVDNVAHILMLWFFWRHTL